MNKRLRLELNRVLSRVKYKTLDGLTKAELNKLVLTLRESQTRIYSKYTQSGRRQWPGPGQSPEGGTGFIAICAEAE